MRNANPKREKERARAPSANNIRNIRIIYPTSHRMPISPRRVTHVHRWLVLVVRLRHHHHHPSPSLSRPLTSTAAKAAKSVRDQHRCRHPLRRSIENATEFSAAESPTRDFLVWTKSANKMFVLPNQSELALPSSWARIPARQRGEDRTDAVFMPL